MRMGNGSQLRHREKRASGDPEANLVGSPQDDKLRLDAVLQSAGNSESRRNVETKGECFAKAYISTAETSPLEDARVSFAHEDHRWPQSPCGTPQEGTPSPHARIVTTLRLRS